jgi:hypothetical protein
MAARRSGPTVGKPRDVGITPSGKSRTLARWRRRAARRGPGRIAVDLPHDVVPGWSCAAGAKSAGRARGQKREIKSDNK